MRPCTPSLLCLAIFSALSLPAFADDASAPATHAKVRIDGVIDPVEWQGARHITDFRTTQPLTGAPGSLPTEAWVMATPEGLAVAFRAVQPAGVPRTLQKIQRDEQAQVAEEITERKGIGAAAEANQIRLVGEAAAAREAATMEVYRGMEHSTLLALALRDAAGSLPNIGNLTITPDLLSGALAGLFKDQNGQAPAPAAK